MIPSRNGCFTFPPDFHAFHERSNADNTPYADLPPTSHIGGLDTEQFTDDHDALDKGATSVHPARETDDSQKDGYQTSVHEDNTQRGTVDNKTFEGDRDRIAVPPRYRT